MFIDRFHRIDPTKTYNFFAPTLVTSSSHKITAKCCILCPKTLLLPEKQLHAIHFFVATRNCLPPGDPRILCAKQGYPITGKSFIVLPTRETSFFCFSLSIRRFWGKGEKWKRKRKRGEGKKRLTQMLLLEPSTLAQHDSIPSNQNHFRSLGCQLHVSKSSPKINLT